MKISGNNIKKIGIFRALQLGDMMNIVPALRALRKAFPSAEITLIGLPWANTFVKRYNNYLDGFIHFPGYPGLPEQPFDAELYEPFLQNIRQQNFDLLLQMQGNGTIVNEMMFNWNAKLTAGFHNEKSWVDSPFFMEYPNYGSEINRHLLLLEHLNIPLAGDELEFPITQEDEGEFMQLQLPVVPQKYVCVHPGSRGAWRQWPPENFALLADACAGKGYTVIVTGTKAEEHITKRVIECMRCNAIDATGQTTLGSLAILIKNAFALIANCTGVSHIASATQTPSVIISMDGEPERWAPLNKNIHFVTDWTRFTDVLIPYRYLTLLIEKNAIRMAESTPKEIFVL